MSSGKTHDTITLFLCPLTLIASWSYTHDFWNSIAVTAGFAFGGWCFNGDLDLVSNPYNRWGPLKFIWILYQKLIPRHRSLYSHGFVVGTALRLVYLGLWGLIPILIINLFFDQFSDSVSSILFYLWAQFKPYWICLIVGLELGAASHTIADHIHSQLGLGRRHDRSAKKIKKRPSKKR